MTAMSTTRARLRMPLAALSLCAAFTACAATTPPLHEGGVDGRADGTLDDAAAHDATDAPPDAPGTDATLDATTPADTVTPALVASRAGASQLLVDLRDAERLADGLALDQRPDGSALWFARSVATAMFLVQQLDALNADTIEPRTIAALNARAFRTDTDLAYALRSFEQAVETERPFVRSLTDARVRTAALRDMLATLFTAARRARGTAAIAPDATWHEAHTLRLRPGPSLFVTVHEPAGDLAFSMQCPNTDRVLDWRMVEAFGDRPMAMGTSTGTIQARFDAAVFDALREQVLARIEVHTPDWTNPNDTPPTCELTVAHPARVGGLRESLTPERVMELSSALRMRDANALALQDEIRRLRLSQDPRVPPSFLDALRVVVSDQTDTHPIAVQIATEAVVSREQLDSVILAQADGEIAMIELQSAISARGQLLQLVANLVAALNEANRSIVANIRGDDRDGGT